MPRSLTKLVTLLVATAITATLSGCGGNGEKPVFKVHGKLMSDGKPMAKAEIAFLPTDPAERGLQARATADTDGRYELYTYRPGDGAPAGEYVVTIYWPTPLTKKQAAMLEKAETIEAKETFVSPDLLKGAYSTARKTTLKATVSEKDNEINFNLP